MVKVKQSDPAKLTDFKALSFDVYSTLIDEPGGLFTSLLPLFAHLPRAIRATYSTNQEHTLSLFSKFERELQVSQPSLPYTQLLGKAYLAFASSLSIPVTPAIEEEAKVFGNSIPTWPAFPDTVAALKALGKRYKLIILSNTTREAISGTIAGPLEGVKFDAVYTAEEIGSYKPDLRNFGFLLERAETELGVKKEELLHTANSLRCDHVPAKEMAITSCWIDRGQKEVGREEVDFTWRFRTLGEMAVEVDGAFWEVELEMRLDEVDVVERNE